MSTSVSYNSNCMGLMSELYRFLARCTLLSETVTNLEASSSSHLWMKPNFWTIYQVLHFWHFQGSWTQRSGTSLISLLTFEELESFITTQNEKLAKSNRFLCANIYNAYYLMVVLVKTSMNLNQNVMFAHASFKIAETIEDCSQALIPLTLFVRNPWLPLALY